MALLQYSPREILGLPVSALPHSEDYIFFQKLLFRLASASTDRESFFVELIGKNRRTVQVEGVIVALKNEGKEIIGFHGAVRDITRQKVLEEERRQLEEELRQAKKLEALGQLAECSSRPDISR
jgi:PAS domain S-box-containing protein